MIVTTNKTIRLSDFITHPKSGEYVLRITPSWDTDNFAIIDYNETTTDLTIEGTSEGTVNFEVESQILDQRETTNFEVQIVDPGIKTNPITDYTGTNGVTIPLKDHFKSEVYNIQFTVSGTLVDDLNISIDGDNNLYIYSPLEVISTDITVTATLYDFTPVTETFNVNINGFDSSFNINGATNVYDNAGYRYYEFKDIGNTPISIDGVKEVDYLVVGGGGAGGQRQKIGTSLEYRSGGGGCGGEVISGSVILTNQPIGNVTVGQGGLVGGVSEVLEDFNETVKVYTVSADGRSSFIQLQQLNVESRGGGAGNSPTMEVSRVDAEFIDEETGWSLPYAKYSKKLKSTNYNLPGPEPAGRDKFTFNTGSMQWEYPKLQGSNRNQRMFTGLNQSTGTLHLSDFSGGRTINTEIDGVSNFNRFPGSCGGGAGVVEDGYNFIPRDIEDPETPSIFRPVFVEDQNEVTQHLPTGGDGVEVWDLGFFGGGGGGGLDSTTPRITPPSLYGWVTIGISGGLGGGGRGAQGVFSSDFSTVLSSTPGSPNTGGGGGGGSNLNTADQRAKNGGSGIVVIRHQI